MSVEDEILRNKIIGTWKTYDEYIVNRETISLLKDGSFIDTLYAKLPFVDDTFLPKYIVSGKYYIEDGLLKFQDADLQYHQNADNDTIVNLIEYIYPRSINFDGDDLLLQRLQVLIPIDHLGERLDGEWESLQWVTTYDRNADPIFNSGLIRHRYNFNTEANICEYTIDYLFESPFRNETLRSNFIYGNHYLEITPIINDFVQFNNNKIYLINHDNMLYQKIK